MYHAAYQIMNSTIIMIDDTLSIDLYLFRSSFDDWRPHLGLLLQSIPFPDEALTHDRFIE